MTADPPTAALEESTDLPAQARSPIACVDVFCGVGGLTHGLLRGGVRVASGVDVDPECEFAYEANNRGAKFVERDVAALSGRELGEFFGPSAGLRLLAGCAPCQPFSTYSRKARAKSKDRAAGKWGLLSEFGRLVRELGPELVTMENVPQLVDHPVFGDFLAALDGYHVWWDVVDCAAYGVPQTRKRLVLLASALGRVELAHSPLFAADARATVRQTISGLRPLAAGEADPNDPLHAAASLSDLNLRRIRASRPGGTWRDWSADLVAGCHARDSGATYPGVYGRMEWDAPAPTITTQSFGFGSGRFGHPEQDRALSLREAAILQTFPADYRFVPEGERPRFYLHGRLIGNAVPVRMGEVVAESLLAHVAARPTVGRVA